MNVWAAVVGLIGVIGGAIIGAIATIYGPTLLHKRQIEQKAAEEIAVKNEAAIRRIVALRSAGKSWLNALQRVADDFEAGRIISLDEFDILMNGLHDRLSLTAYEMSLDHTWVSSGAPARVIEVEEYEPKDQAYDRATLRAYSNVPRSLDRATWKLREDVRRANLGGAITLSSETQKCLNEATRARANLNAELLARIETITGRPADVR